MTELINLYRPHNFDEVIGHQSVVEALRRAISEPSHPHSFLLFGPSGTGKTTIARLIAAHFQAEPIEVNAADYTGVDAVRDLLETARHHSLRGNGRRMYIINEVHRWSANSWDAVLTTLEEPPSHLFFGLTTTNTDRVPAAARTRCYPVKLNALSSPDIEMLVELVAEAERWDITGEAMEAIVSAAGGSPRQALSLLQAVHDAPTREEVQRRIVLIDASDPVKEICQMLLTRQGLTWPNVAKRLASLDDFDEAIIGMGRYLAAVMLKNDAKQARRAWEILDALVYPSVSFDRKAIFMAAIGRVMFTE